MELSIPSTVKSISAINNVLDLGSKGYFDNGDSHIRLWFNYGLKCVCTYSWHDERSINVTLNQGLEVITLVQLGLDWVTSIMQVTGKTEEELNALNSSCNS
jgi:hypothetical protein